MIRKTFRYAICLLVSLGFSFMSCDDYEEEEDLCYECKRIDATQDVCYSDYEDYMSMEEFKDHVENFEQDGWTCERKD